MELRQLKEKMNAESRQIKAGSIQMPGDKVRVSIQYHDGKIEIWEGSQVEGVPRERTQMKLRGQLDG